MLSQPASGDKDEWNEQNEIVLWLWQALREFDDEGRRGFLKFFTGSTRIPLDGFDPGMQPLSSFSILNRLSPFLFPRSLFPFLLLSSYFILLSSFPFLLSCFFCIITSYGHTFKRTITLTLSLIPSPS